MKKLLRPVLKILLGLFLFIFLGLTVVYMMYDQPLPKGTSGGEADAFANRMLDRLNVNAYRQTAFLQWSFRNGKHRYLWDKKEGKVRMEWEDFNVLLHLDQPQESVVFKDDIELGPEAKAKVIREAKAMFNNDSFWLVAPFKVFDPGTTRQLVALEDGSDALLVTHSSGGTTPGDSYLWILGDYGLPVSYKMWVKIIPIGGLEASWYNWKKMESGIMLPTSHQVGPLTLEMGVVRAFNNGAAN
jgi:hypothetical protein